MQFSLERLRAKHFANLMYTKFLNPIWEAIQENKNSNQKNLLLTDDDRFSDSNFGCQKFFIAYLEYQKKFWEKQYFFCGMPNSIIFFTQCKMAVPMV